jgi:hypothetical protein
MPLRDAHAGFTSHRVTVPPKISRSKLDFLLVPKGAHLHSTGCPLARAFQASLKGSALPQIMTATDD